MPSDLSSFIDAARGKGMDAGTIRHLLLAAGWKDRDIAQAIAARELGMEVPMASERVGSIGGAREAFLHLLTFSSLYTTVISLTVLFFTYVNRLFPDPAMAQAYWYDGDRGTIRWSMAAVIVTYPLFLWMTRLLLGEMREHPDRAWSGIRRWLTYLTLFVAALALIGDAVTLLYNLLDGELTMRFILKVVVVVLLAGLTFAYYFLSLKSAPAPRR